MALAHTRAIYNCLRIARCGGFSPDFGCSICDITSGGIFEGRIIRMKWLLGRVEWLIPLVFAFLCVVAIIVYEAVK